MLNKVQASVFINMKTALSLPLIEQNVNSKVWADGKLGLSTKCRSVFIKLKDPHLFSHQKQYLLKPVVLREG